MNVNKPYNQLPLLPPKINFSAKVYEKAIKANPKFIKGYYRKSQALFALGKAKESKQVLLSVVKNLQVNNKDINDRIKILTKIIKE